MRLLVTFTVIAALLFLSPLSSRAASHSSDLEGFEEPEAAVIHNAAQDAHYEPISVTNADASAVDASTDSEVFSETQSSDVQEEAKTKQERKPLRMQDLVLEFAAGSMIIVYIIVFVLGMRANNKIGEAWARAFACPGGMFDRNFSYRGPKETGAVLMRESAHVFKFYASGRRYCQGLLADLQLLPRQDFMSMLWQLVSPSEDLLKIEVFMHEAAMPPIILAVATARCARVMQNNLPDINKYTRRINVGKDTIPSWPTDKLWVLAEHSAVFQDLFSDPRLQQLFSCTGPHASTMKLFRSLHFTSENSEGKHKQVLRFNFKLPAIEQMGLLAQLMDVVPVFIDIVGSYKMSPELKKKALDARTKQAEADEETKRKRLEALQQKKQDKAQEERARLLRMTPEARQKAEEKIQRQMQKKAMKSKVVRM